MLISDGENGQKREWSFLTSRRPFQAQPPDAKLYPVEHHRATIRFEAVSCLDDRQKIWRYIRAVGKCARSVYIFPDRPISPHCL